MTDEIPESVRLMADDPQAPADRVTSRRPPLPPRGIHEWRPRDDRPWPAHPTLTYHGSIGRIGHWAWRGCDGRYIASNEPPDSYCVAGREFTCPIHQPRVDATHPPDRPQ